MSRKIDKWEADIHGFVFKNREKAILNKLIMENMNSLHE